MKSAAYVSKPYRGIFVVSHLAEIGNEVLRLASSIYSSVDMLASWETLLQCASNASILPFGRAMRLRKYPYIWAQSLDGINRCRT